MFTGLVEALGTLVASAPLPKASGQRVRIASPLLKEALPLGASLAVDGVCLTVTESRPEAGEVAVDVGPETLSRSTLSELKAGRVVHLERALRVGDRLGGHLVAGHVDGVGQVAWSRARGDSWDLEVRCPPALLRYIVEKGSIALDGVSLTVNAVDETGFQVSLVPHTQECTHLAKKAAGARVNLEVDLIGKYVEKLLAGYRPPADARSPGLSLLTLKEHGFADSE